jgi:hypothetical protein
MGQDRTGQDRTGQGQDRSGQVRMSGMEQLGVEYHICIVHNHIIPYSIVEVELRYLQPGCWVMDPES